MSQRTVLPSPRTGLGRNEAGAPVIFIQHESKSGYLEYGSAAWQLASGLEVEATDTKVRKTTPDAFLRTELEAILKNRGIARVVVCGMHSEFCVDTTTRRALERPSPMALGAIVRSPVQSSPRQPGQPHWPGEDSYPPSSPSPSRSGVR